MSTLHERLLAWLGPKSGDEGMGPWGATRAVLELHAPRPHKYVPAVLFCDRCDLPADQCVESRAIASALGVEIGETPK